MPTAEETRRHPRPPLLDTSDLDLVGEADAVRRCRHGGSGDRRALECGASAWNCSEQINEMVLGAPELDADATVSGSRFRKWMKRGG